MRKLPVALALVFLSGGLFAGCSDGSSQSDKLPLSIDNSRHSMINGMKDTSEAHRAVVSLYMYRSSYNNYSACTGTLIHPQWVLTAGHCVTSQSNGYVYPSSSNQYYKIGVGNTSEELRANLYDIEAIYYHETYGDRKVDDYYETLDGDVALVKLKEPIPESVAKPILALPASMGITREQIARGVEVEFVGFGYDENGDSETKISFKAPLANYCGDADGDPQSGCQLGPVIVNGCHPDKSYCSGWYYGSYCSTGYFCLENYTDYVWLPHGSIYYEQDNGGPCQGDSGGPAFVTIDGVQYVAGLTSYGDAACAKTGISTAVQDYFGWILDKAPEVAEMYVNIELPEPDPVVDPDESGVDEEFAYVETFDNIDNKGVGYSIGGFNGVENVRWSYITGRTDMADYAIDGAGLILHDGGVITGTVATGVGKVSVDVKKAFSSIKSRTVDLYVGSIICDTITLTDDDVHTLLCDVDLSGNVKVSVQVGGAQVSIDNIRWTSHE